MVDYEFYVNTYLGSAIPETAFDGAAERAARALTRFKRLYQVNAAPDAQKLALCAMAEEIYADTLRPRDVESTTMGNVSVRYAQTNRRALERKLYEQALLYLDIYRGVG